MKLSIIFIFTIVTLSSQESSFINQKNELSKLNNTNTVQLSNEIGLGLSVGIGALSGVVAYFLLGMESCDELENPGEVSCDEFKENGLGTYVLGGAALGVIMYFISSNGNQNSLVNIKKHNNKIKLPKINFNRKNGYTVSLVQYNFR